MFRLMMIFLALICVACGMLNKDGESPFIGEMTITDGTISDVSGDLPFSEGDPVSREFSGSVTTDSLRFELYSEDCTGTGRLIQCGGGVEIYELATNTLISTVATPQAATSVTVQGNLAYITWRSGDVLGGGGLVIVDVSAPENVIEIGAFTTFRHALDVAFADENTLYLLTMDSIAILDVRDPSTPRSIGTFSDDIMLMDIAIGERRAYVIAGSPCAPSYPLECDHRLLELDIQTPDAPQITRTIDLPDPETPYLYANQPMVFVDGLLYVPIGDSRFVVLLI